ncbi:MAG TPA: hypothetical protein VMS09_01460 [Paenibacillus sp.]|uniref:hypothetical protein n=1 Tax=Paenibacillus sp. TaxID=58172 RepID=UPI0028D8E481|nr:hypothetical protein [Paenibacillus sp.]HUC90675.1 hypothetical protein [Paenibacillus sp.]
MTQDNKELLRKLSAFGMQIDPAWQDRLDEPASLGVVLETMLKLLEKLEPPHRPYD